MAERAVTRSPRTTSTRVTAEFAPELGTGSTTGAGTVATPAPAARARVVRRPPGYGGLVGAVLFFCLSLTPSLLPRSWLLQGVVGGLTAVLGYGLGASVGWAGCVLVSWRPGGLGRRRAWVLLAVASVVLVSVFLWLGARWQAEVRALMGMDRYVVWSALGIVVLAAAVFGLVLLVSRAVGSVPRALGRGLGRFVPRPVGYAIGVVVAAFLVIGFVQGFLFDAFVEGANRASSLTNGTTSPDAREPTSPSLSGGPGSLVAWDTLGSRAGISRAGARPRSNWRRSPGGRPHSRSGSTWGWTLRSRCRSGPGSRCASWSAPGRSTGRCWR